MGANVLLAPENGSNKMRFRPRLRDRLAQIGLGKAGQFREMTKQAGLERPVSVDRDRESNHRTGSAVDVMTSVYSQESPAIALNETGEFTARERRHMAISTIRSFPPDCGDATSTERQPSIASYKFCSSSSKVSPSVAQPGMAGTSAQKPPSSASCTTTLIFIAKLRSIDGNVRCEGRGARLGGQNGFAS